MNAALREVLSDDVLEFAAFIVFEMFRETVTGLSTYGEFPRDINLDAVDYNKTNLSFIKDLYTTALPDDVHMLDDLLKFEKGIRDTTSKVANNNAEIERIGGGTAQPKIALPSVRSAKQFYPIAPWELINFFLEENIYALAKDARDASKTSKIRALDVRNYLRQTLETAYYAMAYTTPKAPLGLSRLWPSMSSCKRLLEAIYQTRVRRLARRSSGQVERTLR